MGLGERMRGTVLAVAVGVMALAGTTAPAQAEVFGETIEYESDGVTFEGYAAIDEDAVKAAGGRLPGVLIVHQWMGLTDYEKARARQLAELGYVAFAIDVYGKGVRPKDQKEAGAQAGKFKGDRKLFRERLMAGLDAMKRMQAVVPGKIAAIGYCFGGTGVLELARAGADVLGVVSFHGGLDSPRPKDGANIKAKVMLQHGAADPYVKEKDLDACLAELTKHGVDWQLISHSGAVHAFTQPMAGDDPSKGAAYDKRADERSWGQMNLFLAELFVG